VVPGLARVDEAADAVTLGSAARLADVERWARGTDYDVLADVIAQIANPQIREMATVGGNLCQQNRCWFLRNDFLCYKRGGVTCPCYAVEGDHRFYHAVVDGHRCQSVTPSDLGTALAALGATVEVRGAGGSRTVEADALYSGPGETVLRGGEVVESVRVPRPRGGVAYEKLNRSAGDFAVVSVACSLDVDPSGVVRDARVVLGAVAPVPWRARDTERALLGRRVPDVVGEAAEAWTRHAHPLATNGWKVDAAVALVRRTLLTANDRATGGAS